jgi:hypothetical protein
MRGEPPFVSWTIHLPSEKDAEKVDAILDQLGIEHGVIVDQVRAHPGGIEVRITEPHFMGNYFTNVCLEKDNKDPRQLRLTFRRDPSAGRFWKDVMVSVLQSIRTQVEGSSITIDEQENNPPAPIAE